MAAWEATREGGHMWNAITDVPGILVGQVSDMDAITGCTVLVFPDGAVGGVDIRGSATGTREIDTLSALHLASNVHAITLAGGSAFGLDAAGGVMRALEEQGIGFPTRAARVPLVPAAIVYDLGIGSATRRPDADMGYAACRAAAAGSVEEGNAGAGTGATVGKLFGMAQAMQGGVGTASQCLNDSLWIGALAVCNAFGDVVDPRTGQLLAGTRQAPDTMTLADTAKLLRDGVKPRRGGGDEYHAGGGGDECPFEQAAGPKTGATGATRMRTRSFSGPYRLRWRHRLRRVDWRSRR